MANLASLDPLLRGVSRSFYLSLRVLPKRLRPQISLAYLLARASDTVADTKVAPREKRLDLLREMREGRTSSLRELAAGQALAAERELLERLDECMALKASLSEEDQALISSLLDTIIGGQIFDLERFPGTDPGEPLRVVALEDDAELDRYTYMVAGCVGEFWTRICAAHLRALRGWDLREMVPLGVRLGKGLQLVNVLRDVPRDLRIGRCYLPVADPARLLDPSAFPEVRSEYSRWLDAAVDHFDAGWRYTLALPVSLWRIRLACAWPIWIGLKTVALLRRANPLDPAVTVRVHQEETNRMLLRSALTCWHDKWLSEGYEKLRMEAASDDNGSNRNASGNGK